MYIYKYKTMSNRFARALHEVSLIDGAVVRSTEVATTKARLVSSISNAFVQDIFKKADLVARDGKLFIEKVPFETFYDTFKRGYAVKALETIAGDAKIPNTAVEYFARQALLFPESRLERGIILKNELTNLSGVDTVEGLQKAAKESTRTKSLLDVVSSKIVNGTFIGFSITLSVVGLSLYEAVSKYRDALTGCFRYEALPNGNMKVCKVLPLSCQKIATEINVCPLSVLTESQRTKTCAGERKDKDCIMCDSTVTDKSDPNFIPEYKSIPPTVVYRCNSPDFGDALADMTQDYVTSALSKISDVVSTGFNLAKYGIYAIVVAAVLGVLFIIYRYTVKIAPSVPYTPLSSQSTNYANQPTPPPQIRRRPVIFSAPVP